ncbi:Band 7 domain containing protein [Rhabdaerophilaceae bacterium]
MKIAMSRNRLVILSLGSVFALIGLVLASPLPFSTVPAGHAGVVKRLGSDARITGAGLVWKLPVLERIEPVSTQTQLFSFPAIASRSADGENFAPHVRLTYRVMPEKLLELRAKQDWDLIGKLIGPVVLNTTRELGSKTSSNDLYATYGIDFANALKFAIKAAMPEGVSIENITVESLGFSPEFEDFRRRAANARRDHLLEQTRIAERYENMQLNFKADQLRAQQENQIHRARETERARIDGEIHDLRETDRLKTETAIQNARTAAELERWQLRQSAELEQLRKSASLFSSHPEAAHARIIEKWNGQLPQGTVELKSLFPLTPR